MTPAEIGAGLESRVSFRPVAAFVAIGLCLAVGSASGRATGTGDARERAGATTARIEGDVVDFVTDKPVSGAVVSLPEFGLTTRSDSEGRFAFAQELPTVFPYRQILAIVKAAGYGQWTVDGLPLYAGDTLRLHAEMRATDYSSTVTPPDQRPVKTPQPEQAETAQGLTCTGWDYDLVPPQTIKVDVGGTSKQYDFLFYVKHVLPSEWIPSWGPDALRAGAIAAKTFGWWRTQSGNARTSGSGCYDIYDDTRDQVFNPSYSTAATDQAVNATFGSINHDGNGNIWQSHYYAGSPGDPCKYVTGQYAGWMSQNGTQTCDGQGKQFDKIVETFYPSATWDYLFNLCLNPWVESNAIYAWLSGSGTTLTRRSCTGSGCQGTSYMEMYKPAGRAVASEQRPFEGSSVQKYHASASVLCYTSNSSDCSIILKVEAIESNGTHHTQQKTFSVARDDTWHTLSYDPGSFGVSHTQIELRVWSDTIGVTVGVDGMVLKESQYAD